MLYLSESQLSLELHYPAPHACGGFAHDISAFSPVPITSHEIEQDITRGLYILRCGLVLENQRNITVRIMGTVFSFGRNFNTDLLV